jgi:hypothetical protein
MNTTWVVFRRYPAVIHAELAKSALQAYGVDAAVLGAGVIGGARQHESLASSIDLMVKREDLERARDILGPEERFSD